LNRATKESRQVKVELRQLVNDEESLHKRNIHREILDLQQAIGGLEREKKRLQEKCEIGEQVTSGAKVHERIEADKQIPKLKNEILDVEVKTAMIRRQKRKLNRVIEQSKAILTTYSILPPLVNVM
jgi:hypothetical protein